MTGNSLSDLEEKQVLPALAALVLRMARQAIIDNRLIAGTDRSHGQPIGLTSEDRKAMALTSRVLLKAGLPDSGAEIHVLLHQCTRPLGEWLPERVVTIHGASESKLINSDEGTTTPEAEDLAQGFGGQLANLQELLFSSLMEQLNKQPRTTSERLYTDVREFVVRHPLATEEQISDFAQEALLPSPIWMCMRHQFYEPVPFAWGVQGTIPTCAHCGDATRQEGGALNRCRTTACAISIPHKAGPLRPHSSLLRVVRGIRQFWIEPGLDEIRLFDDLKSRGFSPRLYPHRDRCDIDVGDIGIDLKSYASPELLGAKLKRSIGGLAHYPRQLLVIPDWLVKLTPSYLERLRFALDGAQPQLKCLSASQVYGEMNRA